MGDVSHCSVILRHDLQFRLDEKGCTDWWAAPP
jgi:hypothetical protein